MVPIAALPHSPDNVRPVRECGSPKIDQVFIGSCTNGRLEDIAAAARMIKGRRVADGVRCIVIPASYEVYNQAMDLGYLRIFTDAGAVVCTPTCGPCLGGHMGVLGAGERCVSTSNRNFTGRMGSAQSEVILASPLTAAASAVTGRLTDPRDAAPAGFFDQMEV